MLLLQKRCSLCWDSLPQVLPAGVMLEAEAGACQGDMEVTARDLRASDLMLFDTEDLGRFLKSI